MNEEEKKNSDDSQPAKKETSSNELKDEQLNQVAGGNALVCSICGVPIPCACIP